MKTLKKKVEHIFISTYCIINNKCIIIMGLEENRC